MTYTTDLLMKNIVARVRNQTIAEVTVKLSGKIAHKDICTALGMDEGQLSRLVKDYRTREAHRE